MDGAARSRLLLAAGQAGTGGGTLDQIAGQAAPDETLPAALRALFPDLNQEAVNDLATFFAAQRARNRSEILAILRTCQGYSVLQRAQESLPSLLVLADLEKVV